MFRQQSSWLAEHKWFLGFIPFIQSYTYYQLIFHLFRILFCDSHEVWQNQDIDSGDNFPRA